MRSVPETARICEGCIPQLMSRLRRERVSFADAIGSSVCVSATCTGAVGQLVWDMADGPEISAETQSSVWQSLLALWKRLECVWSEPSSSWQCIPADCWTELVKPAFSRPWSPDGILAPWREQVMLQTT